MRRLLVAGPGARSGGGKHLRRLRRLRGTKRSAGARARPEPRILPWLAPPSAPSSTPDPGLRSRSAARRKRRARGGPPRRSARTVGSEKDPGTIPLGHALVNDEHGRRRRVQQVGAHASEQAVAEPAGATNTDDREVVPVALHGVDDLAPGAALPTGRRRATAASTISIVCAWRVSMSSRCRGSSASVGTPAGVTET